MVVKFRPSGSTDVVGRARSSRLDTIVERRRQGWALINRLLGDNCRHDLPGRVTCL